MKLLFTPEALKVYENLKTSFPEEAEQVRDCLKEIVSNPTSGGGCPVALTGALQGLWSREFGLHKQIIYSISDDTVKVFSVGERTDIEKTSGAKITQTQYTEDEYRSVLAQMEANRGKGGTPKVGIFWYNVGRDELFGVVSHPASDYSRANASDGRITCSELHEDIWKKEFHRQRYKNDGIGPFIGAYQDKPRGRVFYNIDDGTFEVATGKWLQDYPHVYNMILEEFNLPPEKTSPKYAVHWDIGQSWR